MSDTLVIERPKIRKRRDLPERDAHRPWQVSWEIQLDNGATRYTSFYANWEHARLIAEHTVPVWDTGQGKVVLTSVSPIKDRIRCVLKLRATPGETR